MYQSERERYRREAPWRDDGRETTKASISDVIEPGDYEIRAQCYEPDPICSLILHRFDTLA